MVEKPVALITGTSSGFGLMSSIALANAGYHVVATMRDTTKSTALEEYIQNGTVEVVELDVTKHEELKSTVDQVINRLGKVDVLINNAGYAEGGFVEDVTMEQYRNQFETNFFGLIAVTKAVLPYMRKQKAGKIINISSVSGRLGFPSLSPYVSSKYAVEGFSESLRLEMLPYGIYVTLIEPGSYKTDIWAKSLTVVPNLENSAYQQDMKNILSEINKIADNAGNPQEVTDLIVRVAKSKRPKLRYPIGKGVKTGLLLKNIFPWEWLEKQISKR